MSKKETSLYKNIPEDAYNVVFWGDAEEVTETYAAEQHLTEKQKNTLVDIVESVFLGDVARESFLEKLEEVENLTEDQKHKVVDFFENDLFSSFSDSIQQSYRQRVSEKISEAEPKKIIATSIPASAVPTHKPMGFGVPQKNMDILSAQEAGAISYQPGVSLKDTLLREDSSKTSTTNPSESTFAKKLSSLDEEEGK
jgi:hypothetical protein